VSEGSGALWRYLRERLLPHGIHATRIENEGEAGFPDVHYTYRPSLLGPGHSGTLELKYLRKKNPPFGDQGLRLSQKIWIRDELDAGGRALIVAQVQNRIFVLPGRLWEEFNEMNELMLGHHSSLIIVQRQITPEIRKRFAALL
jgi:hypothetical protein